MAFKCFGSGAGDLSHLPAAARVEHPAVERTEAFVRPLDGRPDPGGVDLPTHEPRVLGPARRRERPPLGDVAVHDQTVGRQPRQPRLHLGGRDPRRLGDRPRAGLALEAEPVQHEQARVRPGRHGAQGTATPYQTIGLPEELT